jgi:hypothetical protein
MTPHDLTNDDQLLRDRLRTLALPVDTVPQWDDVCRRTTHRRSASRPRLWRPLVAAAALLSLAGAAAAIADAPLPNLPWQGDARPGYHVGEIQALTNMAVFQTPRVPTDELPSAAASALREFTANRPGLPAGLLPGTALLAQSRLLLSDIGPRLSRLYVVPTTKGQVCELVMPDGGGGCIGGFARPGHPISTAQSDNLLVGLVPDDITAIAAIESDGTTVPVTIQRNAFAVAAAPGTVQQLKVTFTDGTTMTLSVP